MRKVVCACLLLRAACPAQTVEGNVLDASTGIGIPGVRVELLKGTTAFYEAASDGGGHFRFDGIQEADYGVRYRSPDYWLTAGSSDYRTFHAAAGSPVQLEARLMPWSRISGRVLDLSGNPVPNAELELQGAGMLVDGRVYLRTSWGGGGGFELGDSNPPMAFRGNADAHGRFEVQTMPGSYTLSAIPPPALPPPGADPDSPALAWKQTWYPAADRLSRASTIVVLPGVRVADVDIKLVALPTRAVRGVVLQPGGAPAANLAVSLGPGPGLRVSSRADGSFEFPAVAEGSYRISVVARGSPELRAAQWIELSRHDLENLQLRLVPPLSIRGRVLLDLPKDTTPPKPKPGNLVLVRRDGSAAPDRDPAVAIPVDPDAQGEFTLAGAYPGLYGLGREFPQPAPYYLDQVLAGGADLVLRDAEILSEVPITVVFRTDGGSVRGAVEHCDRGGVLLVPRDPSLRGRGFSRSAPCQLDGRYQVQAVRPGEYLALAFAGNGPALDPGDALLSQAVPVTVRPRDASTLDLRAVTRSVY